MEQPEHRKNAGQITALVKFIINALVCYCFFNTNHTAFFKETN